MAAVPSVGRAASVAPATGATERLYEMHHRNVYAFCLSQLRDRDDAAEAVQTTFMQALTALRRGVEPNLELPWLIAIARNVCRSRWDAVRRRRLVELVRDPHDLAALAPAREAGAELLEIESALALLPEPQRRAVVLRDWHGLSYQEIAEAMGISLSAAETLIHRGRRALAHELGADEKGKRSFGITSLLGSLKSTIGGGLMAKVAVGTVAVVGVGVTAAHELAAAPAPAPRKAAAAVEGSRAATPTPTRAKASPAPVRAQSVPRAIRTDEKKRRAAAAHHGLVAPTVAGTASHATPSHAVPVAGMTTTSTVEVPATAPSAPADSAPSRPAHAASPTLAPPASSKPDSAPAKTPLPSVTDVAQPAAGAVGTVAGAAGPVVTQATETVGQVVTTVTDVAAPVLTTVTNVLPTPPTATVPIPPVHLP